MTICIMRNNSECALLYVSVKKDYKNLYDKYVESIKSHNNETTAASPMMHNNSSANERR